MNKQLIPCLYLHSERAVTGFGKRNLFGDGNVETLAKFYGDNGADELLVFDFSSADAEHDRAIGKIRDICRSAEIPVIAAGNNQACGGCKELIYAGCRKSCAEFFQGEQYQASGRGIQTFRKRAHGYKYF